MLAKSIFSELLHLFFPRHCPACRRKLIVSETELCIECLGRLQRITDHANRDNVLSVKLAGLFPFKYATSFSVFVDGGILQAAIHELKYRNNKKVGLMFGRIFGRELLESHFIDTIDMLVPVPLHPKKKRMRGYNQSEIIAMGISGVTNVPVVTDNLIRVKFKQSQTKKSKRQRQENVSGSFDIANTSLFANRHILLIDDVITTGSTIAECAKALLKCPNITISIAAVGRVELG